MTEDFANLNQEAIGIWEQMAPWWDSHMDEDGNRTHRSLVAPTTERLLDISAGETVLEAACGAGIFARRMAEMGASVVAFDASKSFLDAAEKRTAHMPSASSCAASTPQTRPSSCRSASGDSTRRYVTWR